MIKEKEHFIFLPRSVVVGSAKSFMTKTKVLCFCRVKTITKKFFDQKITTHYLIK